MRASRSDIIIPSGKVYTFDLSAISDRILLATRTHIEINEKVFSESVNVAKLRGVSEDLSYHTNSVKGFVKDYWMQEYNRDLMWL